MTSALPTATGIAFTRCEPPLPPALAIARGAAAARLALRVAELPDDALGRVECAVADQLLVLRAPAEELLWVDGIIYLGRLPGVPELLVPTLCLPAIPGDVLLRALRKRCQHEGALAWLPDPEGDLLIPLGALATPSRSRLLRFAEPVER